tara:strand:- start:188 stop:433 length:246 start_codon:yes stop_codon:yes gene_type:complete
MEAQIKVLQEMMMKEGALLNEAHLWDGDIHVEVLSQAIKVEWNGGTGYGNGHADYAETLKEASDDSYRKIQESFDNHCINL